MRIAYGGAPWSTGADEGPSPDTAAEITLHRTAHSTLAGHVSGASHQWATTALELAGFAPAEDGIHQLSTDDPDQTRQALHQLRQSARDLDVTVTLSPQPYLGDIAVDLAQRLPGHWEVDPVPLPEAERQRDLLPWVWSPGPLTAALERHRIPCAARLIGGDTELLLVQSDNECVIGAMLPSPGVIETFVAGPSSISAASTDMAASLIQNRLLPQYQEAVFSSRLTEADDDLRWAQETYEPGDVVEPYSRELAAGLNRFLDHAPELIAHLRRAKDPLAAHDAAFLDDFEAALGQAQSGGGDAMALWLTEGEELIELTQAVPTRQTTVTRPATPTAVPVPPPAAVTSTARSR
ncbi:hypothetical protein ABR737_33285 [Streptomyces sp. Edi2]|uniref:hypothetical protein n=1 Tax=Streptomyces sp. Edi2 TaxID=3162528 RepID=UPI0033058749